ncbi:MAG: hypothetical protein HKN79_07405 [Flavobacteriales bacterium]|nr:hypothetical protein [Flavobacteriales bacterium]
MRHLLTTTLLLFAISLSAFEVVEVSPARNIIDATPDAVISITFDESVDINSVVGVGDVSVFGRWSGPADIDITVDGFGNTLTINAFEPFFAGEYVMVNLASTVSSLDGTEMGQGFAYGFWIRTLPGPIDLVDTGHLEVRLESETFIQSYGAYAGDLDHDGWGDLVVVNEVSNDIRIFMSDQGTFSDFIIQSLPGANKPSSNEGTDLNMDGEIDLVIGNTQGDVMSVVMGDGSGGFGPETTYQASQGVRGVCVLDIDGDGDMDAASASRVGNEIHLYFNDADGNLTEGQAVQTSAQGETAILAADMNEDGLTDLVIGGYVSDELLVLENLGDGTFEEIFPVDCGDGPWMIGMGDVNGDGHIDIGSANSGDNTMSIHLGDGLGGLSEGDYMSTGSFPLAIDFGDLDGDGDLDVISSNYSGGDYSFYENLGTGEFDNLITYDAEIAGSCALFHDRDNDGMMEITGIDELADVLIFLDQAPSGLDDYIDEALLPSPNPFQNSFTLNLPEGHGLTELILVDGSGKTCDKVSVQIEHGLFEWSPEVKSGLYFIVDPLNNRRLASIIKD